MTRKINPNNLRDYMLTLRITEDGVNKITGQGFRCVEDLQHLSPDIMKELNLLICDRIKIEKALKDLPTARTSTHTAPEPVRKSIASPPNVPPKPTGHSEDQATGAQKNFRKIQQNLKKIPMRTPSDEVKQRLTSHANSREVSVKDVRLKAQTSSTVMTSGQYYQLDTRLTVEEPGLKLRRVDYGTVIPHCKEKTILMIGESGGGKSTTINSIINFMFGITIDDTVKLKLIKDLDKEQIRSQTDWITIYTIRGGNGNSLPFTLNIVDTPGFGDTQGLSRDKETAAQFKELFNSSKSYGLAKLDAVCIVMKATTNRVNANVKYITECVLSMFGKDIRENICIIVTFIDSGIPPVIASITEYLGLASNKYFQWNNLWMSEGNDNPFASALYGITVDSFKEFVDFLETCQSKSLNMSKEVLDERSLLEEAVDSLQGLIKSELGDLTSLEQLSDILKQNGSGMITWSATQVTKQPSKSENMNCPDCYHTCRTNFKTGFFGRVFQGKNKRCRVCSCLTKKHKYEKIIFVKTQVEQRGTRADLEKQYRSQGGSATGAINEAKDEKVERIQKAFYRVNDSIENLNRIALRPTNTSIDDYANTVIQQEERDANHGYQGRVEILKKLKEQNKLMLDVVSLRQIKKDEFL